MHNTNFKYELRKVVGEKGYLSHLMNMKSIKTFQFGKVVQWLGLHVWLIQINLKCFKSSFKSDFLKSHFWVQSQSYFVHKTEISYDLRVVDDNFLPTFCL